MTVTLDIPNETEVLLRAKAELQGLALQDYLVSLFEADINDYDQSEADKAEEIAILRERIQDRISGDNGIFLEDYWVAVLANREARAQQQAPEKAA